MATQIKTLQVRVKDRHAALLRQMAFEVNQVFNFINEMTAEEYSNVSEYGPKQRVWLTEFDVNKRVAGIQKERQYHIGSATVQEISKSQAKARKQFKRSKLRWRKSGGANRSLGWIPFRGAQVQWKNGCVKFAGYYFKIWDSYGLSGYKFRAGSFAEDARGRWYFNVAVEYECEPTKATAAVGIDLGLKDIATTSDGEKLPAGRWYRDLQGKLGIAQRAHNKKRVRAIHAKIKNRRKDAHHKFSTALVNRYAAIFVGDVSSSKLAKTKLVKSIYDAGWSQLKNQIQYKAMARGVIFEVVDEAYTTQTCSHCGAISHSSPKGRAGLGIREWTCVECGVLHDRDVNAARNILAAGHSRLAGGIPFLGRVSTEVCMPRDHELLPGDSPTLVAVCTGIDRAFSVISPDDSTYREMFPNLNRMKDMDRDLPRDFCQAMIDLHWMNSCRESLCTRTDADVEGLQHLTKRLKCTIGEHDEIHTKRTKPACK